MANFSEIFSTWWRLARGEHGLMSFLAVIAAAVVATGAFSLNYLLFAAGPALIVFASFILNDYFDLPSDKALGRKDRPLVSKQILPKTALLASIALFAIGLALCFISSFLAFEIALAYSLLSIAYSLLLKKLPLLGNAVTATTYGISFLYGNAVAVNSLALIDLNVLAVSFAIFAFLAGFGRELLITLRDVEGDKKIGALTLPMLLGPYLTAWLASLFLLSAIAATYFPIVNEYFANNSPSLWAYLLLVGVCDAILFYCAYSSIRNASRENLSKIRDYTLKAFQLALLGFFVVALLKIT